MRTAAFCLFLALMLPLAACDEGPSKQEMKEENLDLSAQIRELTAEMEESNERLAELQDELQQAQKARSELEEKAGKLESDLVRKLEEAQSKLEASKKRIEELEAGSQAPETAEETIDPSVAAERLATLGRALLQDNEHEAARVTLLIARQLGRETPIVHYRLGLACAELAMWDNARKNYAAATDALESMERDLTDAEKRLHLAALLNEGVALERMEKYTDAADRYVSAMELDAEYAPPYYNFGVLYARHLGDPEQAIAMLRKHVVFKGRRSDSALDLIEELQAAETEPEDAEEPAEE